MVRHCSEGSDVTLEGTKCTLASVRTFPSESQGWTIHFIERASRYWVEARAGHKANELFEQGTSTAWGVVNPARFIRWFTDGERRYGKTLETGQCLSQSRGDNPEYRRRKVWREGLKSRLKIKGSQRRESSGSRLSIPSRRLVRPVRFMPITIRAHNSAC